MSIKKFPGSGDPWQPTIDKFWERIKIIPKTGCLEWQGSRIGPHGYGSFYQGVFIQTEPAHRYSYRTFVGEIKKGKFICHHCDNPPCVNPKHLFMGSPRDNMRDMIKKGRAFWQKHKFSMDSITE